MQDNNVIEIDIPLEVIGEEEVLLDLETQDPIKLEIEQVTEVSTNDYKKLINKPKINGTELYSEYNEIDPTVPEWAKGNEPEEISGTQIEFLWKSIFK